MIDEAYIEEMWGPRCESYEAGCGCCDMWLLWDDNERLRGLLTEAREWVQDAHRYDCDVVMDEYPQYATCNCGRDAILKATEAPR